MSENTPPAGPAQQTAPSEYTPPSGRGATALPAGLDQRNDAPGDVQRAGLSGLRIATGVVSIVLGVWGLLLLVLELPVVVKQAAGFFLVVEVLVMTGSVAAGVFQLVRLRGTGKSPVEPLLVLAFAVVGLVVCLVASFGSGAFVLVFLGIVLPAIAVIVLSTVSLFRLRKAGR